MSDSYYKKAVEDIAVKARLWDHPPSIFTPSSKSKLEDCWIEFFKLRVFNWIPEAIIGNDWKPCCPNCGETLCKNGTKRQPRLVFGMCNNYWRNAPNHFLCRSCQAFNKTCNLEKKADKKTICLLDY